VPRLPDQAPWAGAGRGAPGGASSSSCRASALGAAPAGPATACSSMVARAGGGASSCACPGLFSSTCAGQQAPR